MVNNQLKNIKKKGPWLGKKTHLKKKNRYLPSFVRSPGSRVNLVGRPSLTVFLLLLVFHLTQTILATRSTCRADPSLITMLETVKRLCS